MSLLTQPPVVPAETETKRTHELSIGTEVVRRDGTSAFVTEVGADAKRIFVQLSNGEAKPFRRGRRWRVVARLAGGSVALLSAS
ncbi:hypothetical protein [Prauserella muralis]|uniref:Uncharacterized protein n=1 Tax=Prauserella muralis TaxID=588067 RepID=A0A2V4APF9_9PSEU|nr:hypothetical protein [Prauserella muralis]PXY16551.1 hypothetical protein BAY60_35720 [Prauserella muralis]TWE11210.1 hypothetical protein FHX69_7429 [Prauserella muralis]